MPRVIDAIVSSSAVLDAVIISGVYMHSMHIIGLDTRFLILGAMSLIFIASLIYDPSSLMVGKYRSITANGITMCLGMCTFCMADKNSLTFVVAIISPAT